MEYAMIGWSYKWHKFTLSEKKNAKYTGIFNLLDLAHIHRVIRVQYGDAAY